MTTIIGAAPSAVDTHVRLLEEAIGESSLERVLRLTMTPAGKILPAPLRKTPPECRQVDPVFRPHSIGTMKRVAGASESIAILSKFDITA
ncbi:hypothetical protein [Burkholderia cepacia]|uniref:hypothetical protein n=1 Tax=Burkholderia cepacia TaxID=292 RepID=UPI002653567C|nr:hypothetical protein [Burkholderia cepacia]MDN7635383.1 hypothetical protein [Burkholderia cepacia]